MMTNTTYRLFWKPICDRIGAVMLLVICLPVMLLIALVLMMLGHNPVFRHQRPGFKGRPFTFYKFKSMQNGVVFPFGKWLRKSSLDELPQLLNILKGDMSFIGPRPLLMEYLEIYTAEQHQRHDVKPGVTGWAQVNGRNERSFEDKMKLDVHYVQGCSLKLDLLILGKTIAQLFKWHQSDYHAIHPKISHSIES